MPNDDIELSFGLWSLDEKQIIFSHTTIPYTFYQKHSKMLLASISILFTRNMEEYKKLISLGNNFFLNYNEHDHSFVFTNGQLMCPTIADSSRQIWPLTKDSTKKQIFSFVAREHPGYNKYLFYVTIPNSDILGAGWLFSSASNDLEAFYHQYNPECCVNSIVVTNLLGSLLTIKK